jgi:uncharacterized membrane protein YhaH (DUF805 family)
MLGAIRYHFTHLTDFSGRDSRQTFWFWFLFLFLLNTAGSLLMTGPIIIEGVVAGIDAAGQHGDPQAIPAEMMAKIASRVGMMIWFSIATGVVNVMLMAAAFTRRVHDSGKAGLWAGLVGVVYIGSLAYAWSRIDEVTAIMQQASVSWTEESASAFRTRTAGQQLVGWIPLILLAIFGFMKSDPGANRYGAEPVRF